MLCRGKVVLSFARCCLFLQNFSGTCAQTPRAVVVRSGRRGSYFSLRSRGVSHSQLFPIRVHGNGGQATDPSHAVVPGATVTLTDTTTKVTQTTVTNEAGRYIFVGANPGVP